MSFNTEANVSLQPRIKLLKYQDCKTVINMYVKRRVPCSVDYTKNFCCTFQMLFNVYVSFRTKLNHLTAECYQSS